MTREELNTYIDNCILLGNVITKESKIYKLLSKREYSRRVWDNLLDSVYLDGMYLKRDVENNIHLVYYDGEYEVLDLGDCIDIIDEYAFAVTLIVLSAWDTKEYHPKRKKLVSISGISVSSIGHFAFVKSSVRLIDFPNVKRIGECCFKDSNVEEVFFNNLEDVPNKAFGGSSIRRFYGEKVRGVNGLAFAACTKLEYVYIPNAEYVDIRAFWKCNNLCNANIIVKETSKRFLPKD
jgi:hypothetical protein